MGLRGNHGAPHANATSYTRCGGKRRYSRSDAMRMLRELARTRDPEAASMNAYRCDECRRWHVGHRRA